MIWKASGLGTGFSAVSVVGSRVYTQGHIGLEEHVLVLDAATGRKLWSVALGLAERVAYPGSRSTPTVDGALLYMETVAGDVVCLDARSRHIVWRKHLKRDFGGRPGTWGYAESPLVDGDRVIVTPGGKQAALVALDKHTGGLVWQASIPDDTHENWKHSRDPYADPGVAAYSSVIVAEVGGVRQYVQLLQQGVVGVRASDGKFLWRDDSSSNEYANCPTPIFHDGYLFSASGWRGAALVQLIPRSCGTRARLVYANRFLRNMYGGFFFYEGHVYGCSKEILTCMNFLTGEVAWKHRSVGMGSVVYADGHFVMRGDKGTIALVEATPEEYREKGRFDQPDRSDRPARSYPVITGGRLYLRDEGVLLCYNVRAEGG